MIAVILAAGMASRLRPLTNNTPKCLLDVKGRSLLERSMDALIGCGVNEFVIVTGYLNHMIQEFVAKRYGESIRVNFIHNDIYETTNNIYSLWLAGKAVNGKEFLLLDSDLLYDPQIAKNVLASPSENVLTLIKHELGEEEMKVVVDANGAIVEISKTCSPAAAAGESLGIEKIGASYSTALYKELDKMMNQEHLENKFYELAFERLIPQGHTYTVLDASDYFSCELDTVADFENAKSTIPLD
ncbi:MAG: phosphocholine cytidylyltransferase family protein [Fibrobacter sp.]|uniref:phosphocholine cytidylyltransferase family protein n=1 Tax=Fibrobacter sp. TaxID=35828 RepID=UPI00388DD8BF|nr:phosphocholine cytidylyltransferase family protein [Fibrobacter sp.]